jgi:hypothetical protein
MRAVCAVSAVLPLPVVICMVYYVPAAARVNPHEWVCNDSCISPLTRATIAIASTTNVRRTFHYRLVVQRSMGNGGIFRPFTTEILCSPYSISPLVREIECPLVIQWRRIASRVCDKASRDQAKSRTKSTGIEAAEGGICICNGLQDQPLTIENGPAGSSATRMVPPIHRE